MTREILFRGFHECENGSEIIYVEGRTVKGEWVEGLLATMTTRISHINVFESDDGNELRVKTYPVISSTVGQFTGLDDKNSRKIFEGDKCTLTVFNYDGSDSQHLCEIGYDSGCFFAGNDTNFYVALRDVEDTETDITVTGTIFDKPRTDEAKTKG